MRFPDVTGSVDTHRHPRPKAGFLKAQERVSFHLPFHFEGDASPRHYILGDFFACRHLSGPVSSVVYSLGSTLVGPSLDPREYRGLS